MGIFPLQACAPHKERKMDIIRTLFDVLVDLGEVGIALAKITIFAAKVVGFLISLPLPIAIVFLLAFLFFLKFFKHICMCFAGIGIAWKMSLMPVKIIGIILLIWGIVFIIIDDLPRLRKEKTEKKKKKKKE